MITIKQRVPTQYGRNNFSPDCPWQLYIFSFMHMLWGFQAYFCFDMSQEITLEGTPSTDAEVVMQQLLAFSMLYVGVLFAAMTYHNKHCHAKITTLSNVALICATAFLTGVVFTGNASFGGLEKSWMHISDMFSSAMIVAILFLRVTQPGECQCIQLDRH
jgi:magnesium-transporting ATPase (P-type)